MTKALTIFSVAMAGLLVADFASAATPGATFTRNIRRKMSNEYPEPTSFKKGTCVCQDGGTYHNAAGIITYNPTPDGFGNQTLEVVCNVMLIPVDETSGVYDVIRCDDNWLPLPPK